MSKTFILEIGCEEIPAAPLDSAAKQLELLVSETFSDARLGYEEGSIHITPRRIIIEVRGLSEKSDGLIQRFRGPSVAIAFDAQGNPTKAAEGFARGKSLMVRDLVRGKDGDVEYVYAVVEQIPRDAVQLLPSIAERLITGISWPKSQRWGSGDARFARPVRWLLALYGTTVIPVSFAGLEAGRTTRGHRFLAPDPIEIEDADLLLSALQSACVVADQTDRAALIRRQIAAAEEASQLVARVPASTFSEVVNLVEYPTVLIGHFDEEFLEVPSEIITDAMLSHQRYFPLYTSQGELSSSFLLVSNGDPRCAQTIISGNERVVRARLSDAAFFYSEDLKRPLEAYVKDLDNVVFQEKLGTMGAKAERMVRLVESCALEASLSDEECESCKRAALLCKADLVTNAVVEFTSQQGVMGGYYARAAHENEDVATAIEQHYRPRFAGDVLPEGIVGQLVAFSDKIDTICGIFAIGQAPTGSSDPFALRRAALGCIALLQSGIDISLARAIERSLDGYTSIEFDRTSIEQAIKGFFSARLGVLARDAGYTSQVVEAVLSTGIIEPTTVIRRCDALTHAHDDQPELFDDLAVAYKRAHNLSDPQLGTEIDVLILNGQEIVLLDALARVKDGVATALIADDYPSALACLAQLRAPIDVFFEEVMIMDKDENIRNNRLRLLNQFVLTFKDIADFEKLSV